jgi:hypothetical protein
MLYTYPNALLTWTYPPTAQGEGTQPPSLLSPPGPGSERLCNAMETKLPHSPSLPLPASLLWNSRQPPKPNYLPNTRLLWCTDRNCRPAWHRFQPQGGKEYTVHSIQYTVQTFGWLLLSFAAESSASGPQSGKAPYLSLTLPHLFY